MNDTNECLTHPDHPVQSIARQLATSAFPHVALTGEELTALVAAAETGVDTVYDLAGVLRGRAYWRTGRVLSRGACQVLQRLERRNGDAAPDHYQQPSRVADVPRTPLDDVHDGWAHASGSSLGK